MLAIQIDNPEIEYEFLKYTKEHKAKTTKEI